MAKRSRIRGAPVPGRGGGGDSQIVPTDTPIAELADEIARVLGHQGERDTLPSAGRNEGDERGEVARARDHADGMGLRESAFYGGDIRGECAVRHRSPPVCPEPRSRDDGHAVGVGGSDRLDGGSQSCRRGDVGDIRSLGLGGAWRGGGGWHERGWGSGWTKTEWPEKGDRG